MQKITRRKILKWGVAGVGGLLLPISTAKITNAQTAIFTPPFAGPPSLSTWYVGQWYGNTQWAYRQRNALYGQGQGLHFGLDFFAPCGSTLLAIGDGVVSAIDGPYGSAPHNIVINHGNGYHSLYGHLHQRSSLSVGQSVKQGQQIGISGAPSDSDCDTRPHVHLEIRTNGMSGTTNPVPLIQADWAYATLGESSESLQFELDLNNPTRWQNIYDQPDVSFGAGLLNSYARPWPPNPV